MIDFERKCHKTAPPTVFSRIDADVQGHRPLKAALNVIVYFWRPLAQICPAVRAVEEAMLVCAFSTPDDTTGWRLADSQSVQRRWGCGRRGSTRV